MLNGVKMNNLLLDTHILIWLMNDDKELSESNKELLRSTAKTGLLMISAMTIWEISMLEVKKRIVLIQPIFEWVNKVLFLPYMKIIDVNYKIAIEANNLPSNFHDDPVDRIIVATSRITNIPLITRDKKIISYSKNLFLKVIEG